MVAIASVDTVPSRRRGRGGRPPMTAYHPVHRIVNYPLAIKSTVDANVAGGFEQFAVRNSLTECGQIRLRYLIGRGEVEQSAVRDKSGSS